MSDELLHPIKFSEVSESGQIKLVARSQVLVEAEKRNTEYRSRVDGFFP